mmetsp:Transcript_6166/g.10553  ORF Transcript_6166/g.10553 Transcript_6166/m.10553 type:complete len:345 (-) Transcript_6166:172-1206(-)|eukprot:CAMPEP_0203747742 /NCGR_PEP_ID=MMETSP0098-20131031/2810_1 /ASSEMBLY_ACC=CAM_ASM_000208 /TAXON_ID=96639 /ORGANISM=" , Strain NY0313808BC1" /LENGTH=344 /DNA_ID=CAMNT_0050636271 /DNA_START=1389 /DNA_END=2423 /DNA_ORIENTATION=-
MNYVCATALLVCFLALYAFTEFKEGLKNPSISAFTPEAVILFILLEWCTSVIAFEGLFQNKNDMGERFRGLDPGVQRKVIVYLMELVWGSIALVVILIFSTRVFTNAPDSCKINWVSFEKRIQPSIEWLEDGLPTLSEHDSYVLQILQNDCIVRNRFGLETGLIIMGTLYTFEVVYAGDGMRKSLVAHHISTLLVAFVFFQVPFSTPALMLGIITIGLSALEQPTFFAMAVYRLAPKESYSFKANALKLAWISFGLTKLVGLSLSLYILIEHWDNTNMIFAILFAAMAVLILGSQVSSTYAQYLLWRKAALRSFRQPKILGTDSGNLPVEKDVENNIGEEVANC